MFQTCAYKRNLFGRLANRLQHRNISAAVDTTQSEILQFNQLQSRKKRLKFEKSTIHDWGLFALEPIEANAMIIEYVGEVRLFKWIQFVAYI